MKKLIAIIFLVWVITPHLIYSQTVVSTGGTTMQNSNGMISFTIGEVYIGNVQNNNGSASQGFQQPWDNLYGIQGSLDLENLNVATEDILCYNALNTITVNGLTVNDGGSLTLIAGESVLIFPEAKVFSGGNMHAYISNVFCSYTKPLMVSEDYAVEELPAPLQTSAVKEFFRVFPNPFKETFTLIFEANLGQSPVTAEIYGVFGEKLQQYELQSSNQHVFNLSDNPKGIYLLRVYNGLESGTLKVIKQ